MKNKKGITLVALIITIIVMVILAGVIIVSAVIDGGVIDKAKGALKEQEKADVQEIIIGSYVYKKTASSNTFVYLDLEKTATAIFNNLTSNSFEIVGIDRIEDFYQPGDLEIELEVKGNYGTYIGIVNEVGLKEDLISKPEEDKNGETEDLIPNPEEDENNNDDDKKEEMVDLEKLKEYFEEKDIYTKIGYPETREEIMSADISEIKFKNDDILSDAERIELLNLVLNNETIVVTMQYNNNKYIGYVRASDSICTLIKKAEKLESELEIYLFGENNEGKFLLGDDSIYDFNNNVFLPDIKHPEIDVYKDIKVSHVDITTKKIVIRYNEDIYTIFLEEVYDESGNLINYKTNKDLGFSKYKTENNLGKYVEYEGIKWIVLTNEEDGVELISANTLDKVALGNKTDGKLAREVYNDAINILTSKCEEITGITVGGDVLEIRNVGGPAEDSTTMEETLTLRWEKHNGSENGFKKDDENYKTDLEKMTQIGISNSDNSLPYWVSSRAIPHHNGLHGLFFDIRVCALGTVDDNIYSALLYIADNGTIIGELSEYGVRPVIKIKKQLFESKITTGEGTEKKPIKLD